MSDETELSEAQREQRREARTTHGAHSYLARTKEAEQITSDMALVESAVIAEADSDGPRARVRKQALRFATAAELLWGHMITGAEAFEKGLQKWGWLAASEIRAWRDWAALKDTDPGSDDPGRILEQLKGKRDEQA